jgi:hypothetical protein
LKSDELIPEQALGIAKHDSKFHHLLKATAGVVFLGTPHRGADLASWGDTLATCAAAFGLGPDTQLLNILRKDSDRLREIFNDFAILANEMGLDLICFYELYPTNISYRRGVLQYLISSTSLISNFLLIVFLNTYLFHRLLIDSLPLLMGTGIMLSIPIIV